MVVRGKAKKVTRQAGRVAMRAGNTMARVANAVGNFVDPNRASTGGTPEFYIGESEAHHGSGGRVAYLKLAVDAYLAEGDSKNAARIYDRMAVIVRGAKDKEFYGSYVPKKDSSGKEKLVFVREGDYGDKRGRYFVPTTKEGREELASRYEHQALRLRKVSWGSNWWRGLQGDGQHEHRGRKHVGTVAASIAIISLVASVIVLSNSITGFSILGTNSTIFGTNSSVTGSVFFLIGIVASYFYFKS